jgi:2-polyprenyl-3-methyl-5-hydroxy-6-metoxy-1,4-benzoquinol methylase
MRETNWTKERIQDLLEREKLVYQKIELPYGLATSGKDRSQTSDMIFADSIKGKSVLDIGCCLGYFCHEAIRRGASRVVGIDVDENRIRQARQIADCLGMDIEFKLLESYFGH